MKVKILVYPVTQISASVLVEFTQTWSEGTEKNP